MNYRRERKQVLEVDREIAAKHLVVGTWGNVSFRIRDESLILITPSGMDYQAMSIEDLVLVNFGGEVIKSSWKPSVETPLHLAIYQERPDVGGIVHVHSPNASAFAVARQAIPVILEETAQIIGHPIETAPYARCGSAELGASALQTLSQGKAVLLANHGLVGVGIDCHQALKVCFIAERTAMIALSAHKLGQVYDLSPADIQVLQEQFASYGQVKERTPGED